MNEELLTHLEELGLSQKEARVYLANLMIGPASVQKIADQAGIKRVTTYVILESLINLGLVSQSTRGKKTFFTAEEPASLQRLLDKKQQQLEEQKQHFADLIPQLKQLKSLPAETPSVKFYDSAEGIRTIFSTFYATHKEIKEVYGISNLDQLHEFFPELKRSLTNPERVKHSVSSKFIYTSKRGAIYKETDAISNRESRWLPPEKFPLNGEINIVGDYIIMLSLTGSKPIGVMIQSSELAMGMKAVFSIIWETAKSYN